MPRIGLTGRKREKLLNEASISLMDPVDSSVPIPTKTVLLALQIVNNLAAKISDSGDKRSVREIYLESKAFTKEGELLPF